MTTDPRAATGRYKNRRHHSPLDDFSRLTQTHRSALNSLLKARGMGSDWQRQPFFYPQFTDLESPFAFQMMEKIVDRLWRAHRQREKILIISDRDVDGLTATTLLCRAFAFLGWRKPEIYFPEIEMGNGLNPQIIASFAKNQGKVIITCDCGIRNVNEAKSCVEAGLDLIITDHHLAAEIPHAFAILNPKLEPALLNFQDLAACGVAFKLACALILSTKKDYRRPLLFAARDRQGKLFLHQVRNGISREEIRPLAEALVDAAGIFALTPEDREHFKGHLKPDQTPILFPQFYQQVFQIREAPPMNQMARHFRLSPHEASSVEGKVKTAAQIFGKIWCHRFKPVREFCEKMLEILAIGTIGDLVPLRGENRLFVKMGLKTLEKTQNPGLKFLLQQTRMSPRHISNREIATQVIPYLNSPGRMGQSHKSLELLLLEGDSPRAAPLFDEIIYFNNRRKEMTFEAYNQCEQILQRSPQLLDQEVVLITRPKSSPGVSGIVAAKLAKEHQKPMIIITVMDGLGTASCRSHDDFNIYEGLVHCQDLLLGFGGHPFAAGFTIAESNIPLLAEKLNRFATAVRATHTSPARTGEAEIEIEKIEPGFIHTLLGFKPFGVGNPPPLFFAKNVRVSGFSTVGVSSNNILFEFPTRHHGKIHGLAYNQADQLKELPTRLQKINITFNIETDSVAGLKPKLRIHQFEPAGDQE